MPAKPISFPFAARCATRGPYEQVMQVALIPVAYTQGTTFRPAPRHPVERVMHWDYW